MSPTIDGATSGQERACGSPTERDAEECGGDAPRVGPPVRCRSGRSSRAVACATRAPSGGRQLVDLAARPRRPLRPPVTRNADDAAEAEEEGGARRMAPRAARASRARAAGSGGGRSRGGRLRFEAVHVAPGDASVRRPGPRGRTRRPAPRAGPSGVARRSRRSQIRSPTRRGDEGFDRPAEERSAGHRAGLADDDPGEIDGEQGGDDTDEGWPAKRGRGSARNGLTK